MNKIIIVAFCLISIIAVTHGASDDKKNNEIIGVAKKELEGAESALPWHHYYPYHHGYYGSYPGYYGGYYPGYYGRGYGYYGRGYW